MKDNTTTVETGAGSSRRILSDKDIRQFDELGFMTIPGVLDPEEDIKPLVEEYSALLDREIDKQYAAGKLTSRYEDLPFLERFARALCESDMTIQPFDICLTPRFERDTPMHLGPAVFHHILRNPRILDVVEDLIGPEIYSNPVQHVRIKPPESKLRSTKLQPLVSQTPWHQDMGVISDEADKSDIITVWVAVSDVTVENSCLVVIPGSHKTGLAPHCPLSGIVENHKPTGIPDKYLAEGKAVPLPVPAGTAIIFNKKVMHSALPNTTDSIRWSFDLRFNPVGQNTGRSWFPGFVARSRSNPESELRDVEKWGRMWRDFIESATRDTGTFERSFTRWSPDHPACA